MPRFASIPLLALILGLPISAVATPSAAPEVRLVRAELHFNGELLLKASTSDHGKPNVDTVWSYLPELRFSATPEFEALRVERELGEDACTLKRGDEDGWIRIEISYGGRAERRELSLLREGDSWRLTPDQLALGTTAAASRWIRRSAADDLPSKGRR